MTEIIRKYLDFSVNDFDFPEFLAVNKGIVPKVDYMTVVTLFFTVSARELGINSVEWTTRTAVL